MTFPLLQEKDPAKGLLVSAMLLSKLVGELTFLPPWHYLALSHYNVQHATNTALA